MKYPLNFELRNLLTSIVPWSLRPIHNLYFKMEKSNGMVLYEPEWRLWNPVWMEFGKSFLKFFLILSSVGNWNLIILISRSFFVKLGLLIRVINWGKESKDTKYVKVD